jgi:gluconolactonase
VIDLATDEGVRLVNGQWRYSDTRIIQTDFLAPGSDGQPGAGPVKTYDYEPHAGGIAFDDSKREIIAPTSLGRRRSTGRLCFNWYRISITVPERIGDFETRNSPAVLETSLDDYAEFWLDGELSRYIGQNGGSVVAGWNGVNRLVVGRNLKPGQKIQLAVFGINGPLSNPPTNHIWMRFAKLSFYRTEPGPIAIVPSEVNVEVLRKDPAIDAIVPLNAKIHKLAAGFQFTEGPVWSATKAISCSAIPMPPRCTSTFPMLAADRAIYRCSGIPAVTPAMTSQSTASLAPTVLRSIPEVA